MGSSWSVLTAEPDVKIKWNRSAGEPPDGSKQISDLEDEQKWAECLEQMV